MIVVENLIINGRSFAKTYSDIGMKIERDGELYGAAVDPIETGRTYTETDIPIEEYYADETEAKARAYDILMGEGE